MGNKHEIAIWNPTRVDWDIVYRGDSFTKALGMFLDWEKKGSCIRWTWHP
jgi:hypothetical protein